LHVVSNTRLLRPTRALLPGCVAALERGWSPDNVRGLAAAREALERIALDADAYLATTHDPQALGPPITLPDGTQRARIPGLVRWIWDAQDGPAGFAGTMGLRWMPGGAPLPPHVLGHIGYAVVPWKRRQGHGTRALRLLLALAREQGLARVELTTDPDNAASQRVITTNGGVLMGPFDKGAAYGHQPGLRYAIDL
jgi:predicted acetyltransferase